MKLEDYVVVNRKPPTLDEVCERINDISTLPHIVTRVMQVANNPDSNTLDMKEVIESDPALSARVLRCVNSSAYALRSKVSNLQRAITYLGMNRVRSLALTATVAGLFAKNESIGTYRRRDLWKHFVAVGICARLIAMRRGIAQFEDAFVAGLLHDIGIVLADQYVHDRFLLVIKHLRAGRPLVEVERRWLGYDHAMLGLRVAESWCFSEPVKAAIGFHHRSTEYAGSEMATVHCVEVANLICTLKGHTSVGQKLLPLPLPALNALSLNREHITVLAEDLDQEIAKHAALFEL